MSPAAAVRSLLLGCSMLTAACGASGSDIVDPPGEAPKATTTVATSQPNVDVVGFGSHQSGITHEYTVTNIGPVSGLSRFSCQVLSGTVACGSVSPESAVLQPGETIHVALNYTCCVTSGTSTVALRSSLGGMATHSVFVPSWPAPRP